MYVDEPTGPVAWHWTDGPNAAVPVWVGPRLGSECDEICSDENNPGYANTSCARNINDYCFWDNVSGLVDLEAQVFECQKCYHSMIDDDEPCMRTF
jgi:hypothetical protein